MCTIRLVITTSISDRPANTVYQLLNENWIPYVNAFWGCDSDDQDEPVAHSAYRVNINLTREDFYSWIANTGATHCIVSNQAAAERLEELGIKTLVITQQDDRVFWNNSFGNYSVEGQEEYLKRLRTFLGLS